MRMHVLGMRVHVSVLRLGRCWLGCGFGINRDDLHRRLQCQTIRPCPATTNTEHFNARTPTMPRIHASTHSCKHACVHARTDGHGHDQVQALIQTGKPQLGRHLHFTQHHTHVRMDGCMYAHGDAQPEVPRSNQVLGYDVRILRRGLLVFLLRPLKVIVSSHLRHKGGFVLRPFRIYVYDFLGI